MGHDAKLAEDVLERFPIVLEADVRRQEALLNPNERQFRAIISASEFQPAAKDVERKKPTFLFSDDTICMDENDTVTDASLWI